MTRAIDGVEEGLDIGSGREEGTNTRPRIAIAHDYLTQRGGAEKVVLALARAFPGSPIYTTLYDPEGTYPEFKDLDVRVSPLNKVRRLRRNHRAALPILPLVSSAITIDADVVIASSSGWSHGFRTRGSKVVYCYSPARWLYQGSTYLGPTGGLLQRLALRTLRRPLQVWDRRAAKSADKYLAISTAVQQRIVDTYGIDAEVAPAPFTIEVDAPAEPVEFATPDSYYLCISRLLPYKNVDCVIEAFRNSERRLVVVGSGPSEGELRRLAGSNVVFAKELSDSQIRWLYAHCTGLIAASFEDYGLTPLEAASFGKPSAVLRWGGFLDTIAEGVSGVFFDTPDSASIRHALGDLEGREWDVDLMRNHIERFHECEFRRRIVAEVDALTSIPTVAGRNQA